MIFLGLDLAWKGKKNGVCICKSRSIVIAEVLNEEQLFLFLNGLNEPNLIFIDAPLWVPDGGMRKVDLKLRSIYKIGVLPANRKLYPYYFPEKVVDFLLKKGYRELSDSWPFTEGFYYAESFPTLIAKLWFGKRPETLQEYLKQLSYLFENLKNLRENRKTYLPHLLDAALLACFAERVFTRGEFKVVTEEDGRIFVPAT